MSLKAIETQYKGYRFRSRLEARWAIFFDAMALPWQYEPEGFKVENKFYLPDFRVQTPQNEHVWYEVKPESYNVEDYKVSAFNRTVLKSLKHGSYPKFCTVLYGDPWSLLIEKKWLQFCPRCESLIPRPPQDEFWSVGLEKRSTIVIKCESCAIHTLGTGNPSFVWEYGLATYYMTWRTGALFVPEGSLYNLRGCVENAAMQARGARFEHGESPSVTVVVRERREKQPLAFDLNRLAETARNALQKKGD